MCVGGRTVCLCISPSCLLELVTALLGFSWIG